MTCVSCAAMKSLHFSPGIRRGSICALHYCPTVELVAAVVIFQPPVGRRNPFWTAVGVAVAKSKSDFSAQGMR
jgi:hypothetical protein